MAASTIKWAEWTRLSEWKVYFKSRHQIFVLACGVGTLKIAAGPDFMRLGDNVHVLIHNQIEWNWRIRLDHAQSPVYERKRSWVFFNIKVINTFKQAITLVHMNGAHRAYAGTCVVRTVQVHTISKCFHVGLPLLNNNLSIKTAFAPVSRHFSKDSTLFFLFLYFDINP